MTTIDDGGPAFPTRNAHYDDPDYSSTGMPLRDYFAIRAMQGCLASGRVSMSQDKARGAASCYEWADAMLAAREAPSAVSAAELLALVQDLLKVFVHDPFDSQPLVDSVVARAEESVARAQLGVYA
ncbi:hypothetical protein ACXU40_09310 [Bordetella bronchiseptica]